MSIPTDEDGFVGRECSSCCGFFKQQVADVAALGDNGSAWCPYCGERREGREAFMTKQQKARAKAAALAFAEQYAHQAVKDVFRGLERHNRPGSPVTFKVSPSPPPARRTLPVYVEEEVRRRLDCPTCGKTYAVYGASAFCPLCGALPSDTVALDSLARARAKLALEDRMPEELRNDADAEGVFDSFAADAIKNGVTVFETYARNIFFERVSGATEIVRKEGAVFQRLDDLDALFAQHLGFALSTLLDADEWDSLRIEFAERHVLTHCDGLIDQKFVDTVSQRRLTIGQRLVVSRADAEAALGRLEALIHGIASR